jgi:hypothetical protein
MLNKDLRYYERLIENELAGLSSSGGADQLQCQEDDDGDDGDPERSNELLPKKKKLKLEKKKRKQHLDNLELVVGVYKLLIFNFVKYSTKYNYAKLINLVQFDNEPKAKNDSGGQQNDLVKYFCLKITALLLNLSPVQEDNLFSKQFTAEQLENVYLK